MLSLSIFAMLKKSKTSSPQKLFDYDYVTLYNINFSTYLTLLYTMTHIQCEAIRSEQFENGPFS